MTDSQPHQPPPPSRGMIFDLIDRFLKWLDRPWKAFALAGLAILAALGWGGWLSRDALVDAWKMSSGRPVLKRTELPKTLAHLQKETKADIVAYWTLNLSSNGLFFEDGINGQGDPWDFEPHRIPAIRNPVTGPATLVGLMSGQIMCRSPFEDNEDLFNRRMIEDDIHRLCLVPVPPAPNILVGVMVVAWVKDPNAAVEDAALGLARETAATMVSRWE